LTLCHLGIVGQKWAKTLDHWRLGESFMQNFHVVFNATDPEQLSVGISGEPPKTASSSHGGALQTVALTLCIIAMLVFVGLAAWCCIRQRQQRIKRERLEFYQA